MKLLYTVALLCSTIICMAQINYEPGYYIDNKGNKTEGLIRNLAWKNNPTDLEFRSAENAEPENKRMNEVVEFFVSGYKFRRFEVAIDRSSTNIDRMSKSATPQWTTEVLFLKVLVEGEISLLVYEEQNLVKYFYSTGAHDKAEQLMYREYLVDTEIKEVNTFRQQLYNLMKDSKPQHDFERLKYKSKDLIKLFIGYNGIKDGAADLTQSHNKGSVHLSIFAGAGSASMEARDVIESVYNHKFDSQAIFNFGAEVEYVLPFNNNKWSVFVAPYFESYSAEGSNSTYNVTAEYKTFNIPLGARHYMYLNDRSRFFINAAYVLSGTMGEPTIKYTAANTQTIEIGNSSGAAAGFGFAYGPWSAELRYVFQREILQYVTKGATYSSVGILLAYKIL